MDFNTTAGESLFQPEFLLPVQMLPQRQSTRHLNERELLAMILLDAMLCANQVITTKFRQLADREAAEKTEAILWIATGDTGTVTFDGICETLQHRSRCGADSHENRKGSSAVSIKQASASARLAVAKAIYESMREVGVDPPWLAIGASTSLDKWLNAADAALANMFAGGVEGIQRSIEDLVDEVSSLRSDIEDLANP